MVDQQLQKLWEQLLGGPERCHQHHCGTILLNLRQDSSQDAKGRESIKLGSSPTEGEGIHCSCPSFRFPGHKWGKLAVQSACKEVNLWNKGEGRKLFEHHRVKHPFSIVPKIPGMKIRHGVLNALDEGSRQPNVFILAQCHIDKAISLQEGECKTPFFQCKQQP